MGVRRDSRTARIYCEADLERCAAGTYRDRSGDRGARCGERLRRRWQRRKATRDSAKRTHLVVDTDVLHARRGSTGFPTGPYTLKSRDVELDVYEGGPTQRAT